MVFSITRLQMFQMNWFYLRLNTSNLKWYLSILKKNPNVNYCNEMRVSQFNRCAAKYQQYFFNVSVCRWFPTKWSIVTQIFTRLSWSIPSVTYSLIHNVLFKSMQVLTPMLTPGAYNLSRSIMASILLIQLLIMILIYYVNYLSLYKVLFLLLVMHQDNAVKNTIE